MTFDETNYRVCSHRRGRACYAIGFEAVGDMPCECPLCLRDCNKPKCYLQKDTENVNKKGTK